MKSSSYVRGRRFEYKVKKALEKEGWVVFRCAGSRPVDLIALKPGVMPCLIECKYSSNPVEKPNLSPSELETLKKLKKITGAVVLVIFNSSHGVGCEIIDEQ